MNQITDNATEFVCPKCGLLHKRIGTDWRSFPADPNTEAARIVGQSTGEEKPLPADLEAAWSEWSKSIKGVDERGWTLLRAAFEAGWDAARRTDR